MQDYLHFSSGFLFSGLLSLLYDVDFLSKILHQSNTFRYESYASVFPSFFMLAYTCLMVSLRGF